MSNQTIETMNEPEIENEVGNKRESPSDFSEDDTNTKKQKPSLDILKLERTISQLFVGKTNSFSESISAKLVTRIIDSGLLSTTRDGGRKDKQYNCTEKTHLIKLRKKIKNGVLPSRQRQVMDE